MVDTTPPVITVTGSNPMTVELSGNYTELGATADTGETVTASGTVDVSTVGTYTITYTATDAASNVGTATRTVNVVDTTAPIISLNGANVLTVELGSSYTELGAMADTGETVTASGTVDTSTIGTYTVNYTATDATGNVGNLLSATQVVFLSDATWTVPSGVTDVEILVVAGGGSGGPGPVSLVAGTRTGGGAGGLIHITNWNISSASTVNVTVGAGGAVYMDGTVAASNGEDSTVSTDAGHLLTAKGGGHGGRRLHGSFFRSGDGGSGGGGLNASSDYRNGVSTQSSDTNDQVNTYTGTGHGHKGGEGWMWHGGGAGGTDPGIHPMKAAGPGLDLSANFGTSVGDDGWFASGGTTINNGSAQVRNNTSKGGGGEGHNGMPGTVLAVANGDANTGGGGGGCGSGGSGVVIIKYSDIAKRTVNVVDTTAPVISLNGSNPLTVELSGSYTELGATADTGETVTASGTVDVSTVGTYTITYTATDVAGTVGTATRTVNVVTVTGRTMIPSSIGATLSADLTYNPNVHVQTVEIDRTGTNLVQQAIDNYVKWFITKQNFLALCSLKTGGADTTDRFTLGAAGGLLLTDASYAILKFSNIDKPFSIPTTEPTIQYGDVVTDASYIGQVGAIDVSYDRLLFKEDGTTPATASATTTTWSFDQTSITLTANWSVNDSSMIVVAANSGVTLAVSKAYNDAAADFIQIKLDDPFDPHGMTTSSADDVTDSVDYASKFQTLTTGQIQSVVSYPTVTVTDSAFTQACQQAINSDAISRNIFSDQELRDALDAAIESNAMQGIQGTTPITLQLPVTLASVAQTNMTKSLTPLVVFDPASLGSSSSSGIDVSAFHGSMLKIDKSGSSYSYAVYSASALPAGFTQIGSSKSYELLNSGSRVSVIKPYVEAAAYTGVGAPFAFNFGNLSGGAGDLTSSAGLQYQFVNATNGDNTLSQYDFAVNGTASTVNIISMPNAYDYTVKFNGSGSVMTMVRQ